MSLRFVVGQAKSGKTDHIADEIIRESIKNPHINYNLIVPDQFKLEMESLFIKKHPDHGFFNIDILGFNRAAHRIFEERRYKPMPVLDEMGRLLLLRKIYEESKEEFLFYDKRAARIGFIKEIKSVISEFMQFGVNEDILEKLEKELPSGLTMAKIHDMKIIYEKFLKRIEGEYSTSEHMLLEAYAIMGDTEFVKNSVFYIDDFSTFTPIQLMVIEKLLVCSRGVTVTVPMPVSVYKSYNCKPHELFFICRDMMDSLSAIADKNHILKEEAVMIEADSSESYESPELGFLMENLFRHKAEYTEECDNIGIYEANTPLDEIRFVANRIMDLCDKGVHFSDIAVICDNHDYDDLIYRTFNNCGIRSYLDVRKSCFINPYVSFLRSALKIVADNFCYEDVMSYLKSGLSSVEEDDSSYLDRYIFTFNLKGYKKYLENINKNKVTNFDVERLEAIKKDFLDDIIPLREGLKKAKTCEKIVEVIKAFVERCDIDERIDAFFDNISEVFPASELLTLKDETIRIREAIDELLEQMCRIMESEVISLEDFCAILDTGLEMISIAHIPVQKDLVMVGDIRRTRLYDTRYIFLIGANNTIIPKSKNISPVLSDRDKSILKAHDVKLAPSSTELAYIERFNLYSILVKAKKELCITYARTDLDGKAIHSAYIIENIRNLYKKLDIKSVQSAGENEWITYLKAHEYTPRYDNLKPELLNKLWNNTYEASVSNIENFYSCNYAFFLKYSMRLKTKQVQEVDSRILGTLYHNVCENITRMLIDEKKSLSDYDDDALKELINATADKTVLEKYEDIMISQNRNQFLLNKLKEILYLSFDAMKLQLSLGSYKLQSAERKFRRALDEFVIKGSVDRVDLCEKDKEVLVKIVDYKTYDKKVQFFRIFYGLDLQLPLYMKQILEIEKLNHPDKEVKPAAVFYNIFMKKMLELDKEDARDEESLKKKYYEQYRPAGIVVSDEDVLQSLDDQGTGYVYGSRGKTRVSGEEFDAILKLAQTKLELGAEEILSGSIATNPYRIKGEMACDRCDYVGICNLNDVGGVKNIRKLKKLSKEEVLEPYMSDSED